MAEHNEFVNNRKRAVVGIFRSDELIYWLLTMFSLILYRLFTISFFITRWGSLHSDCVEFLIQTRFDLLIK